MGFDVGVDVSLSEFVYLVGCVCVAVCVGGCD